MEKEHLNNISKTPGSSLPVVNVGTFS